MLSPTFHSKKPSLEDPEAARRLQQALFNAASGDAKGDDGGRTEATTRRAFDEDDDDFDVAPAPTSSSSRRQARAKAKAVSAESPTAPFLDFHRNNGSGTDTAGSSSGCEAPSASSRATAAGGRAAGATATAAGATAASRGARGVSLEGGGGGDGDGEGDDDPEAGSSPLLGLSLRAQREFVSVSTAPTRRAVASSSVASPSSLSSPVPPPWRRRAERRRHRRAPAVATLTEEGIAFSSAEESAIGGGARRRGTGGGGGDGASSFSPWVFPPSSPLLPPLLPFCDVLGAEAVPRRKRGTRAAEEEGSSSTPPPSSFLRNCAFPRPGRSPASDPWLVRIHTLSRGGRSGSGSDWKPRLVSLLAPDARTARAWANSIDTSSRSGNDGKPRSLLVVLNPYGGARGAARRVWREVASPLLESAARVRCDVVETERAGHAEHLVRSLSLSELRSIDGVVVVGGDGLFQEALNGLLAIRFPDERKGGSDGGAPPPSSADDDAGRLRAAEASRIRLGHIPAGSTDALAWSVHGTRCPAAAALHVALGSASRLDVLALGPTAAKTPTADGGGAPVAPSPPRPSRRGSTSEARKEEERKELARGRDEVEGDESDDEEGAGRAPLTPRATATSSSPPRPSPVPPPASTPNPPPPHPTSCWPPRAAACMVSCGYFGDLLSLSEKMRWLGPARYGVAGFLALARLRKYRLRVRYLPADVSGASEGVAASPGATPRAPAAPLLPGAVGRAFASVAPSSSPQEEADSTSPPWVAVEGKFSAVLVACLPCRSDRSATGIAPDRKADDGLASLVLVEQCSRLRFLRFLVAVSRDGAGQVAEDAVAASGGAQRAEGGERKSKKSKRSAASLGWVKVVAVRAAVVEPLEASSSPSIPPPRLPWNADGEPLPPAGVAAVVRRGLVRVFARPQLAADDDE